MPLRNRDFEELLQSKFGFERANKADDHRWYTLKLDGLPPIATKASHAKQVISAGLESQIAKQLHVRVPFFRAMMSCTKSSNDYREQIRRDPYPPWHTYR